MNKTLVGTLMASWIAIVGTARAGSAAQQTQALPQFGVCLFNYSQLAADEIREAMAEALRVLREAGVDLYWHYGPAEGAVADPDVDCTPRLNVNILSRQMSDSLRLPPTALGLAPGTSAERNRNVVYVFAYAADRLFQKQAQKLLERQLRWMASKPRILGHAIAHEIGHVLLNAESHAETGIMRGDWNCRDLEAAALRQLLFSDSQASQIQQEVIRRNQRQATVATAALP